MQNREPPTTFFARDGAWRQTAIGRVQKQFIRALPGRGLLWRIIGWDRNAHRYVAGCCSMAQFLHQRVLRRVPESAERRFIWKTNQRRARAKRPVAFHDLLGLHHIKHFAAVFGDRCARVRHVGHELFHVMDDDLSDQIRCHSFYVSSQEELVLCGWSPKGPDHSIAAANKRRSSEEGCSTAFPPATSELSPV